MLCITVLPYQAYSPSVNISFSGRMQITGEDNEGEIRVVEWPGHPFFLATLYVPQASSLPEQPHPLVSGFLRVL